MYLYREKAAAYLGVSLRTLDRYIEKGQINVYYEKSNNTRPKVTIAISELDRLKDRLETKSVKPAVVDDFAGLSQVSSPDGDIMAKSVIEALASAIALVIQRERLNKKLSPEHKNLLTISECQQICGLSKVILRKAILDDQIYATKVGKSLRIKRSELDRYVEKNY